MRPDRRSGAGLVQQTVQIAAALRLRDLTLVVRRFNGTYLSGRSNLLPSYGVNSTNIRIVSTFKPSSRIAFLPSSDCSNS